MEEHPLIGRVRGLIEATGSGTGALAPELCEVVLDAVLEHFAARVGTIHRYSPTTDRLELFAQRGLPEALLGTVSSIPVGKGMAGLAAQRREPVQVCNLQTDDSGVAKPGAKLTKMEGSIALPLLSDGELRGAFGIGKPVPHEYAADEVALLEAVALELATRLPN